MKVIVLFAQAVLHAFLVRAAMAERNERLRVALQFFRRPAGGEQEPSTENEGKDAYHGIGR